MINKNDVLTLSDNKKYLVVDTYTDNGINYLYLIDTNDVSNIMFSKLENDDVVELSDPDEMEQVILKFNERLHSN